MKANARVNFGFLCEHTGPHVRRSLLFSYRGTSEIGKVTIFYVIELVVLRGDICLFFNQDQLSKIREGVLLDVS